MIMAFTSLQEILDTCEKDRIPFCEAVLQDDLNERGVTREDSRKQMAALWQAMWDAAGSYEENERSRSGLVGGQGGIMEKYLAEHEPLSGAFAGQVIAGALKMGECNACMKRIVAAPTAGACGVLPAVLVPYVKKYEPEEEKVLDALYTAAGIGQVIAARAYIAGASGGCQAESPPKVVMCPSTGLVLSVDMIPSDEMNAPSGMPPPKDFAVQRMSGVTPACWK